MAVAKAPEPVERIMYLPYVLMETHDVFVQNPNISTENSKANTDLKESSEINNDQKIENHNEASLDTQNDNLVEPSSKVEEITYQQDTSKDQSNSGFENVMVLSDFNVEQNEASPLDFFNAVPDNSVDTKEMKSTSFQLDDITYELSNTEEPENESKKTIIEQLIASQEKKNQQTEQTDIDEVHANELAEDHLKIEGMDNLSDISSSEIEEDAFRLDLTANIGTMVSDKSADAATVEEKSEKTVDFVIDLTGDLPNQDSKNNLESNSLGQDNSKELEEESVAEESAVGSFLKPLKLPENLNQPSNIAEVLKQKEDNSEEEQTSTKHTTKDKTKLEEQNDFTAWLSKLTNYKAFDSTESQELSPEGPFQLSLGISGNEQKSDELEESVDEIELSDNQIDEGVLALRIAQDEELEILKSDPFLLSQIERQKPLIHVATNFEGLGIYTESIAKLYALQGNKTKSIAIYEKLIELFPEKSAFFASQIENLRD